jgi:phage-related protein
MSLEEVVVSLKLMGAQQMVSQLSQVRKVVRGFSNDLKGMAKPFKGGITDAVNATQFTNMNAQIMGMGNTSAKVLPKMRNQFQELTTVGWGWRNVMGMSMDTMKKVNKEGWQKNFTGAGKFGFQLRRLTHGMRGFRMEMLGVMFFGMMLQQMFMGFMQPVMQAFGVFDIFRLMLLVLFLPIMEAIFPYLLDFMMWFTELPDGVKMAIGVLTLIGIVLGFLLFIFGSFALGIGSVILALGPMGLGLFKAGKGATFFKGKLGKVFGPLKRLVKAFLKVGKVGGLMLAIIIAIVIGIVLAIQENFGNIRDWLAVLWDGIKQTFEGFWQIISGIAELFMAILKGDWKGAWEAIKKIGEGLWNAIVGGFKIIMGIIVTVALGVFRALVGIYATIYGAFEAFFDWMRDAWAGIKTWIVDWAGRMLTGMIDKIKSFASKVKDAILGLFPQWARDMIWSAGQFVISIFSRGGGGDDDDETEGQGQGDFIWRPGGKPQSFSRADTLVGFKGGRNPFGGGGVNVTNYNDINVMDSRELQRALEERDRRMVDQIRRLVGQ